MTGLVFVQFSEWQQNHFVFFQQCEVDWCSVFTDVYNHYTTQYAFARLSIFVVLYVRWYRDHCHAAAPKCTVCILRRSCIRKRTALLQINEIQRSLTSGAQRHIKGRNATRVSFNRHVKTAQQWTIIWQYSDWYTDRWWMGCYSWIDTGMRGLGGPQHAWPLLAVPNVTAHPSTPVTYQLRVIRCSTKIAFGA